MNGTTVTRAQGHALLRGRYPDRRSYAQREADAYWASRWLSRGAIRRRAGLAFWEAVHLAKEAAAMVQGRERRKVIELGTWKLDQEITQLEREVRELVERYGLPRRPRPRPRYPRWWSKRP